ncbi:(2Fe-2S) ferredoxin domain-containing protein, partial [Chamaesiphon sp. VAR_69_metabat_338]|uniref:(2Fe-2S) ferredoxin domain-containing protein n=1 Tax=Chamaesiphon sp. VAR_69_metabat_338 TaxID=2964704 RepID=UPI00286DB4BF
KRLRQLTGQFQGWGDESIPHRYIQLATVDGDRLIKVAKSLRLQIQDWQPGISLTLLTQETIDLDTGERKTKVKQLLATPKIGLVSNLNLGSSHSIDPPSATSHTCAPTTIQVCQGSSCRKRGSEKICQLMQTYLDESNLTDRVQIETVKCLHQCKAAPQAIVTSPASAMVPGKTHYRQVQSSQVLALLANHFPIDSPSEPTESNLSERVSDRLQQQHQIAIATTI